MQAHIHSTMLLFLLALLPLDAQFERMDSHDEVLARLEAQSASIESIMADFIQEKKLDFMDERISSSGKFWFRKENSLRWAYEEPFEYAIIINRGRFYINDGGDISSYDIESNAAFREINALIIGMVSGRLMQEDKFDIGVARSEDQYRFRLKPRDEGMRAVISEMEIYLDRDELVVEEIIMRESEDNYTHIRFSAKKINEDIPEAVFSVNH